MTINGHASSTFSIPKEIHDHPNASVKDISKGHDDHISQGTAQSGVFGIYADAVHMQNKDLIRR